MTWKIVFIDIIALCCTHYTPCNILNFPQSDLRRKSRINGRICISLVWPPRVEPEVKYHTVCPGSSDSFYMVRRTVCVADPGRVWPDPNFGTKRSRPKRIGFDKKTGSYLTKLTTFNIYKSDKSRIYKNVGQFENCRLSRNLNYD